MFSLIPGKRYRGMPVSVTTPSRWVPRDYDDEPDPCDYHRHDDDTPAVSQIPANHLVVAADGFGIHLPLSLAGGSSLLPESALSSGLTVSGTACPFGVVGSLSPVKGQQVLFRAGCFTKSLATDDVYCLFEFRRDHILGRIKAGTLRCWETESELLFEARPPKTTWAADLLKSMARGDINAAWVEVSWLRATNIKGVLVISEAGLRAISIVSFSPYPGPVRINQTTSKQSASVADGFRRLRAARELNDSDKRWLRQVGIKAKQA